MRQHIGDPAELLQTYEPERVPVGRMVLRFTDRIFTLATSTNPVVRFARTRIAPPLIPLALRAKTTRRYAFRTVSELRVRYRSSPLSLNGPDSPPRGPIAGDRLPDATVVHDGRSSSLHQAVATPGWHLLLCGPTDAWPQEVSQLGHGHHDGLLTVHHLTAQNTPGALYDPDGTALHRLGLKPRDIALYLVRPDGHIGYRAGGPDRTGLASYLDRWLPPGRPRGAARTAD